MILLVEVKDQLSKETLNLLKSHLKWDTNLVLTISKQSKKLKENTVKAYEEKLIASMKQELEYNVSMEKVSIICIAEWEPS